MRLRCPVKHSRRERATRVSLNPPWRLLGDTNKLPPVQVQIAAVQAPSCFVLLDTLPGPTWFVKRTLQHYPYSNPQLHAMPCHSGYSWGHAACHLKTTEHAAFLDRYFCIPSYFSHFSWLQHWENKYRYSQTEPSTLRTHYNSSRSLKPSIYVCPVAASCLHFKTKY